MSWLILRTDKETLFLLPSSNQWSIRFTPLPLEPWHDKINKLSVHPAKTQVSLGICPVWSESSLSAWRKFRSLATHGVYSEDLDQTGRMPRLIWVFAGRTVTLSWDSSYAFRVLVLLFMIIKIIVNGLNIVMVESKHLTCSNSSAILVEHQPNIIFDQLSFPQNVVLVTCLTVLILTRAGVCKTLCPQHLLFPKFGRFCSVLIPQKFLDFAQMFNR